MKKFIKCWYLFTNAYFLLLFFSLCILGSPIIAIIEIVMAMRNHHENGTLKTLDSVSLWTNMFIQFKDFFF